MLGFVQLQSFATSSKQSIDIVVIVVIIVKRFRLWHFFNNGLLFDDLWFIIGAKHIIYIIIVIIGTKHVIDIVIIII